MMGRARVFEKMLAREARRQRAATCWLTAVVCALTFAFVILISTGRIP